MSNIIIDVNSIKTYPKIFLDFCRENKGCLLNSFLSKDDRLETGSGLFDYINEMLSNISFMCIHVSRILDLKTIKTKGLLNPSKHLDISLIIMEGIKNKITDENYRLVFDELNNRIQNDNKYKTFHFVIGSIDDITLANGFLMLENYGGELLEDVFSTLKLKDAYNEVRFIGIPVAIFFELPKEQLKDYFLSDIYDYMIKKVIYNNDDHFFRESCIYDSVSKESIIDVKELHDYE